MRNTQLWKILFFLICFSFSFPLFAQEKQVAKGRVLDENSESLPGVVIRIDDTPRGVTNEEGFFEIADVKKGAKLSFSYLGMKEKTVEFEGVEMLVVLESGEHELEGVTVVAFGTQKKESVVSSITTISPAQLRVPSSNLTTAFAGQLAGMISFQSSGEPGADNANFFIRGVTSFGYNVDPLILIDNIEVDKNELSRLQVDDIESFSIMKDAAATALYGARGANGVILIKTKEGKTGKAKLTVRLENTFSRPTQEIKLADPITYMKMHNEAIITRNREGALMYSDEKIDNTIPGSGSIVFPSTDWRNELLKKFAMNQRVNLNVSGGGDVARYYVAASFSQDNGILKVDKNNNFNSNIDLQVYTLRSNVNINLTKSTELKVSLNGTFEDYTGPYVGGSDTYKLLMKTNPVLFPSKYPVDEAHKYVKHTMFGNAGDGNYLNPYAEMVRGYKDSGKSKMGAQMELNQDLDFITEGLKFRVMFNTTRDANSGIIRYYNPFYYKLIDHDYLTENYTIDVINPDGGTEYLNSSIMIPDVVNTTYTEATTVYNRTFKEVHNVGAQLVFTMRNQTIPASDASGILNSLPYRNVGLAGRFSYGYQSRYLAEFNFGYNGSERFAKKNRFGFFPSISGGWVVSNEKFFEPFTNTVNSLKLRASYGLAGNDKISDDRFLYLSNINMNATANAFSFGYEEGAYGRYGISVSRYADPEITWEISTKANYAVDITLFKDLNMTLEYFTEKRKDILQTRASIPYSMGLWAIPQANLGKAEGRGTDISLTYNKTFNKSLWLQGRANFTYAASKYTVFEDYDYRKEWWKLRIGNPTTQRYGYIAEGLFIDDADVANSPQQFGNYMAGDIKYRDLNGDGIINDRDMAPIGYPETPEINYGFGLSGGYKGWDFSFFFNGVARRSFWIDYNLVSPFFNTTGTNGAPGYPNGHNALAQFIADSYWSEDNRNPYAVWPRLSTANSISVNNSYRNTWFMRDGAFLRLKSVELGYTIPDKVAQKAKLTNLRVYVTGGNLLCFSKFNIWDPEMAGNGLGYPIQRTFNMGVNLTF
ncbi:MAG: TonB-dependent receptor [Dysgonamonadaceae bacterium]|jgi:TonB-linked SusC/RagA family outer membrane protein|nr:TonB-dependent receptor [Dysgonamonadaceae bacterium]